jgi:hypothetical protein
MSHSQFATPDRGYCTVLRDLNNFGENFNKNDGLTRYNGCSGGKIDSDDALGTGKRKVQAHY